MEVVKNCKNLTQRIIKIKVDDHIFLKVLKCCDISERYVGWLNDKEVTKFTEQKFYKHTIESTKSFIQSKYYSENDLLFGIFFDNMHIGNIKLGPVKFEHLTGNISYFIGEKVFWSRGIASKCVSAVIDFAIRDLGLRKINAGYYESNLGSAKVLEKCGFIVEGVRVNDIIFENCRINNILVGYVAK